MLESIVCSCPLLSPDDDLTGISSANVVGSADKGSMFTLTMAAKNIRDARHIIPKPT